MIHNIAMQLIQDEEIHMAYALQLAELEEAATVTNPVGPDPLPGVRCRAGSRKPWAASPSHRRPLGVRGDDGAADWGP